MKKLSTILMMLSLTMAIGFTACKKKATDAEIKTAIETALKADPMSATTMVAVEKGIATLTGECKDSMCRTQCADMVSKLKDVKSVVNNCTVAPPPPPVVISADDMLLKSVTDALKDFPTVLAAVKDGVVTLTGSVARTNLPKLMMGLQALRPKKVESAGLIKK
jgi:osmotically-inducible protein OsmY